MVLLLLLLLLQLLLLLLQLLLLLLLLLGIPYGRWQHQAGSWAARWRLLLDLRLIGAVGGAAVLEQAVQDLVALRQCAVGRRALARGCRASLGGR